MQVHSRFPGSYPWHDHCRASAALARARESTPMRMTASSEPHSDSCSTTRQLSQRGSTRDSRDDVNWHHNARRTPIVAPVTSSLGPCVSPCSFRAHCTRVQELIAQARHLQRIRDAAAFQKSSHCLMSFLKRPWRCRTRVIQSGQQLLAPLPWGLTTTEAGQPSDANLERTRHYSTHVRTQACVTRRRHELITWE